MWMLTEKLRTLLGEYHRKKWFPNLYPDPYGELIDTLTVSRVLEFVESKDRSTLAVGHYLARNLAQVECSHLLKDVRSAMSKVVYRKNITAESALYHARALDDTASRELWTQFRAWNEDWRSSFENWLKARLGLREKLSKLQSAYFSELKLDAETRVTKWKDGLIATRDFFFWEINRKGSCKSMRELLRLFRWERWDSVADWNDFRSLGRTFSDTAHIKKPPQMKSANSLSKKGPPAVSLNFDTGDAMQAVFPISPPHRVRLQYGKAAGAVDAVRFLIACGRGCFYSGMNPELNLEDRICGDPALEHFWGCLYAQALSTTEGLSRLVGPQAEALAESVRLLLQFWYRHDTMLAVYESRVPPSLKEAKDLYVDSFESAFSIEAPHFLYLYELEMSEDAVFRAAAAESAVAATERLSSLYGKQWFASNRFARRTRDYWWEGFRLTLHDVLQDLSVDVPSSYPFL